MLSCRADHLLDHQRAGNAAAAGGVERVLDGDVVIGDDGLDVATRHLARHVEVHDVAFVVLDDEQDARTGIHGLCRGDHLVGRGRGEDLARTGGIEHAMANEARMQGLMAGATA